MLALDYGSARCGCAISDPTGVLATPLPAIEQPATEAGLGALTNLIRRHAVERVIVGLPVGLSGAEGAQALETRTFVERLRSVLDVPVDTWDERFTTRLARSTPGRHAEDSRAAAHLLQGWLEAHG